MSDYHVIVCTPAGRYRYYDSFRERETAKSYAVYYANRGGTTYVTSSVALAVLVMASLAPMTHSGFEAEVLSAQGYGAKTARFLPRNSDGCPWCEYDGKPRRNPDSSEYRCLCPHCGKVSHLDAWYVKHRGRGGGYTWFTEGG